MKNRKRNDERLKMIEERTRILKCNLHLLFDGKQDVSKGDVAEACHITRSSISTWLSFKRPYIPDICYAKAIADYFGVTLDWLMTDHSKEIKEDTEGMTK